MTQPRTESWRYVRETTLCECFLHLSCLAIAIVINFFIFVVIIGQYIFFHCQNNISFERQMKNNYFLF